MGWRSGAVGKACSIASSSAVLFDIDGTLTDTSYLHARAWRLAFVDAGFDVATSRIHRMIGAGSGLLMRDLIGHESDEVKSAWRRRFEELKPEVAPFPGAGDLLRAVAAKGVAVVLATSSEPDDVEALLKALDAEEAIGGVTSAGDVKEPKPSPEVFEVALRKTGCDASSALVVGDTAWDIQAARGAGLDCITLCCGGVARCELEAAGALAVYEDPADLLAHLDESPLARLWS